jgi:hypothetical protein
VERLTCPRQPVEVPVDQARFAVDVAHDRCPLSGCGLVPFERTSGRTFDGRPVRETTGRCDPLGGGCGVEWLPYGSDEVCWLGREVVLHEDWPEDAEGVADS